MSVRENVGRCPDPVAQGHSKQEPRRSSLKKIIKEFRPRGSRQKSRRYSTWEKHTNEAIEDRQVQKVDQKSASLKPQSHNKAKNIESIVRMLELPSAPSSIKSNLILKIETMALTRSEELSLVPSLRHFIRRYRDDPSKVTAVCSAIRQYIARVSDEDLRQAGEFLSGEPQAPSLKIELEVSKMLVRRLVVSPLVEFPGHEELLSQLERIALAYLNDFLLLKKYYGAVSLNAALAVVLLRSDPSDKMIDALKRLKEGWFVEMLQRRVRQLLAELQGDGAQRKVFRKRCKQLLSALADS